MAARNAGDVGVEDVCGSLSSRASVRRSGSALRETWLCRSTVGAGSDVEEDLRSESSDMEDQDSAGTSCVDMEEMASAASHRSEGDDDQPLDSHAISSQEIKASHTRSRKLTLGSHLDVARTHVLRKAIPPLPLTPAGSIALNPTPHAKTEEKRHRKFHPLAAKGSSVLETDGRANKKKKETQDNKSDAHLAIYMDYEREPGFGKSPKRRAVFALRHVWSVHAALFLSTACVHCVSFNVSPALRRLFRIDTLPVGLCIVVAWTILGLMNCVGAWVGRRGDRVLLLRRLSWLWIVAVVLLQLAKVLPVASWSANTLLGIGYLAAVVAHGLLVPNAIAVGAEVVATKAMMDYEHDEAAEQRQQQSVDVAMGGFLTWGFGAVLSASSLVQAFYFAGVNLELATSEEVLILRSRRSVAITIPCATLLLAGIVTFLFQSRHHYDPVSAPTTETSSSSSSSTPAGSSVTASRARNALERKLAQGAFASFSVGDKAAIVEPKRLGPKQWFQLVRRSVALLAIGFFTLVLVLAVGATLVAHTVADNAVSASMLVHLVLFVVLALSWVTTMVLSASQLGPAPRDKLYGHIDDLMAVPFLPSRRQLFVLVALVCLGSAAALAAFVRAQLYSTLFIQTCQLRRPHDAAVLFDPNVVGAWVGLMSVLVLPCVHGALHRRKALPSSTSRVSPVRRVVVGVLLYLIAVFLASVVELYRRAARWPADQTSAINPRAADCHKANASNFSVLWSLPHLIVLSLADAVFRVGAAEEAYALTAPLDWLGVAQAALSLADSVGYATALALTKTLSPWLYHVRTSDLVLLLLLITAIASLSYALTKRLADHVHASRRPRPVATEEDDSDADDERQLALDTDEGPIAYDSGRHHGSDTNSNNDSDSDAAGRNEARREQRGEIVETQSSPSSSSSRLRLSARALKIHEASRRR